MNMPDLAHHVHLVLVNVRSALNVGSIFRTADALGAVKVWIAGYTPGPDHASVAKTALGAEVSVAWERVPDVIACLERFKKERIRTVGFECGASQAVRSRVVLLGDYRSVFPCALVFGNEVEGLSEMQLRRCDDIVEIPQQGMKESLNVAVAAGIALWEVMKSES